MAANAQDIALAKEKYSLAAEVNNVSDDSAQEAFWPLSKRLKPWSYYNHDVKYFATAVRPIRFLTSPIIWWALIIWTTCLGWPVLISVTQSQLLGAPPYNFDIQQVGLTNIAAFLGGLAGCLVAHPIVDGVAVYMARRNGGVFEPEFRLVSMIWYAAFTATGFFVWGYSIQNGEPWEIPVIIALTFINFGLQIGTTGLVSYIVDSYRDKAAEAFSPINFAKCAFTFGLTFYVNDWIAEGTANAFYTIGGITIAVVLPTIPMYIYGKRTRSYVYRHNLIG